MQSKTVKVLKKERSDSYLVQDLKRRHSNGICQRPGAIVSLFSQGEGI